MRDIILHIGMHKTGTTSIQDALYGIDSQGFRTVRFLEKNHSIPLYTIFSETKFSFHWKNYGLADRDINDKRIEYEKLFEKELADQSISVFLVSGEELSNLNEAEQQTLCRYLKQKNLKVRIIYVVRDPLSWSITANQQRAQSSFKALSKLNPRYQQRISGFYKALGKENISIVKYEDMISRGLIKSFSELIGFKLKETAPKNQSLSSEALALIFALNNIEPLTIGSKSAFQARKKTMDAINGFFSIDKGFNKLNFKEYDILDPGYKEELAWLKQHFDITYPIPRSRKNKRLNFSYHISSELLSNFFFIYGLEYKSSESLVKNIQNLYMKFLTTIETS